MDGIPYAVRATNGKRAVSPGAICRSVTARITSDTAPLSAVPLPTVAAPEAASTTRTLLHATMHPHDPDVAMEGFLPQLYGARCRRSDTVERCYTGTASWAAATAHAADRASRHRAAVTLPVWLV